VIKGQSADDLPHVKTLRVCCASNASFLARLDGINGLFWVVGIVLLIIQVAHPNRAAPAKENFKLARTITANMLWTA
jgi:hypothetical protein